MLGSGRSLSPAAATPPPQRNSSLLSPTTSSVSLNSASSVSPQSTDTQDISSRVSLDQNDGSGAAAAAASSRLVCPICNEEMVGLKPLSFTPANRYDYRLHYYS